jgi:hypothetical protein
MAPEPQAHAIRIEFRLDQKGNFAVTRVGTTIPLSPAQLGIIYCALVREALGKMLDQERASALTEQQVQIVSDLPTIAATRRTM